MTIGDLYEKLLRIKELIDKGIQPKPWDYGEAGELARLLNEQLDETEYEGD